VHPIGTCFTVPRVIGGPGPGSSSTIPMATGALTMWTDRGSGHDESTPGDTLEPEQKRTAGGRGADELPSRCPPVGNDLVVLPPGGWSGSWGSPTGRLNPLSPPRDPQEPGARAAGGREFASVVFCHQRFRDLGDVDTTPLRQASKEPGRSIMDRHEFRGRTCIGRNLAGALPRARS